MLVLGVSSSLIQLATDSNGTHVVQAIIKHFREDRIAGFAKEVSSSEKTLMQVACNCHGICVLKALIDKTKLYRHQISSLICRLSRELALDPFGNFAISKMISVWPETVDVLISANGPMLPKFISELSLQKYSSMVVDKLVQTASVD